MGCLARPAWERNKLSRLECWSLVGGGALRYLKEFCLDRHLSTSLKYIVIKFFLKRTNRWALTLRLFKVFLQKSFSLKWEKGGPEVSSTTLLSGRFRHSDSDDISYLFNQCLEKAFVYDMQGWHLDCSHVILIMILSYESSLSTNTYFLPSALPYFTFENFSQFFMILQFSWFFSQNIPKKLMKSEKF